METYSDWGSPPLDSQQVSVVRTDEMGVLFMMLMLLLLLRIGH